jgi:hypothetical protein
MEELHMRATVSLEEAWDLLLDLRRSSEMKWDRSAHTKNPDGTIDVKAVHLHATLGITGSQGNRAKTIYQHLHVLVFGNTKMFMSIDGRNPVLNNYISLRSVPLDVWKQTAHHDNCWREGWSVCQIELAMEESLKKSQFKSQDMHLFVNNIGSDLIHVRYNVCSRFDKNHARYECFLVDISSNPASLNSNKSDAIRRAVEHTNTTGGSYSLKNI